MSRGHQSDVNAPVPHVAEARARTHIADQLDRAALRAVSVDADDEAVTVVVRGEVGFTLLGLLQPGAFDVRVTSTATPRRSS